MKPVIAILLSAAALATTSGTMAQTAPVTASASVQAGTYTVDSYHTLVQFGVTHFGINEFFGTFPGTTGSLKIDPRDLSATVLDVNVPVASVSTTNATLDKELVSADWLDTAQFPTMHFVSTKVTRTGAATATVAGNLTLHGVTRPVTLQATFNAAATNPMNKAYTLGFKASGTIKRTDFGVSKYASLVSDETTITISAAFERKN